MPDLELLLLLKAQDQASSVISKLASGLGPVGGIALGVGAAIIGIGAASVKMAGDYEQSMLKVQALTGTSAKDMQWFSDKILAMAPDLGQAPKSLMDGLYNVESALSSTGASNADMLNVLKLSAQAAATGMTDTKTVTDGLTNALNAFHIPAKNAGNVMDMLTQTVVQGKMEWPNFSRALGTISVGAHNAHVTLAEAGAALADFTNQGMSTQKASSNLSMLFMQMSTKTDSLAKNFDKLSSGTGAHTKAWTQTVKTTEILNGHMFAVTNTIKHAGTTTSTTGDQFDKLKFNSMNLADKIKYLNDITSKHKETQQQQQSELLKIFGGNSRVLSSYNMLASSMGVYDTNLKAITKSAQGGKTTHDAFAVTQQGFNEKMKEARAALDVVFIEIGQNLLPVLDKFLNTYIIPTIKKFSDWIVQSGFVKQAAQDLGTILDTVGQFVGGLATGLGDVIGWFQTGSAPAQILGAAIAGIGAAIGTVKIVEMGKSFLTFATDTLPNQVMPALAKFLGVDGLLGIKTAAKDASGAQGIGSIGPAMADAEVATKGSAALMVTDLLSVLAPLVAIDAIAGNIWKKIAPTPTVGGQQMPGLQLPTPLGPNGPVLPLNPGPVSTTNSSGTGNLPPVSKSPGWHIPGFASGVEQFAGGLAYVHQDELLVNMAPGTSVKKAGSFGGGHTFNINVTANTASDGASIANAVRTALADMMRSYTPLANITSGGRI